MENKTKKYHFIICDYNKCKKNNKIEIKIK